MDNDIIAIMYSQLKCILVCSMGDERIWGDFCNSTLLLVLVRPVKTDGKDTALMTIIFSQYLAPIITDLQNVKAVVGRAETQKHWAQTLISCISFIWTNFQWLHNTQISLPFCIGQREARGKCLFCTIVEC